MNLDPCGMVSFKIIDPGLAALEIAPELIGPCGCGCDRVVLHLTTGDLTKMLEHMVAAQWEDATHG